MAYKALKTARGGVPGGRDAMRMMQRMGMKVDELPNVSEVIIRTPGKSIVLAEPNVTLVTVQGQTMYQIAGGRVTESSPETLATAITYAPTDADIQLVAEQSGKTAEESREALLKVNGDLASAILLLKRQP